MGREPPVENQLKYGQLRANKKSNPWSAFFLTNEPGVNEPGAFTPGSRPGVAKLGSRATVGQEQIDGALMWTTINDM